MNVIPKNTIPLTIFKYITDTDGKVLKIADYALIPAIADDKYPVWMFGQYDRDGGYFISNQATPPGSVVYLQSFTMGIGQPFLYPPAIIPPPGYLNIYFYLKVGDIVHVYTDNISAPSYYVWVVQRTANAALGSIIGNTKTSQQDSTVGKLFIKSAKVFVSAAYTVTQAQNQWNEPLRLIRYDNLGNFKEDTVALNTDRSPFDYQQKFVEVAINFEITQYRSVNFLLDPAVEQIDILFTLK
jgi:hypothetical protein